MTTPVRTLKSIPSFSDPPRKNDALFLHGAIQPAPFVYCYTQQKIEIVHGPSCIPRREINREACHTDGIPIVKRRGGGGTVVLAPGMVIIVVVGKRSKAATPVHLFTMLHDCIIDCLDPHRKLGIEHAGISDLAIEDRKIAGSSLYLGSNPSLYYYQSALIVDADISLFDRYLYHPPKEPPYRQGRGHSVFCAPLCAYDVSLRAGGVCRQLNATLAARLLKSVNDTQQSA
jgi:lipoate-protein ligase A